MNKVRGERDMDRFPTSLASGSGLRSIRKKERVTNTENHVSWFYIRHMSPHF